VDGDIGGLAALASRLRTYPPQMNDVVRAIDQRVANLVRDAGWWGDAADAFKGRWDYDARGARALAEVVNMVAGILQSLADTLRQIDTTLGDAADRARAAGVAIGSDGRPQSVAPAADLAVQAAHNAYVQAWQVATDEAQRARMKAKAELQAVESLIAPPELPTSNGLRRDQWTNFVGTLIDFASVPVGSAGYLHDQRFPFLKAQRDEAHAKFSAAMRHSGQTHQPIPDDIKEARREQLRRLQAAEGELDRAEGLIRDLPGIKLISIKTGDLIPAARGLRALGDLPFADVVAAVLATAFSSYDDMQKGDDWRAVPGEAAVNFGSIAIGVGITAGIIAIAATSEVTVPAVIVVGGAILIGAAVSVGVGELGESLIHEHWDEDFQQYGLGGGLAHGAGNVAMNTVKGVGNFMSGLGGVKDGIWKGVFG
jgi:uncharacterized protein YukE